MTTAATRFEKRTFRNQYLGPFRESRDEPLHPVLPLRAFLSRIRRRRRSERVWHCGTSSSSAASEDGVLENEFAGNLVEICPTGVFTDATLKRHYTRKWDLQMAPSICVHCGAGLQHHRRRALWNAAPRREPVTTAR